jgi:hypothetical protein
MHTTAGHPLPLPVAQVPERESPINEQDCDGRCKSESDRSFPQQEAQHEEAQHEPSA